MDAGHMIKKIDEIRHFFQFVHLYLDCGIIIDADYLLYIISFLNKIHSFMEILGNSKLSRIKYMKLRAS